MLMLRYTGLYMKFFWTKNNRVRRHKSHVTDEAQIKKQFSSSGKFILFAVVAAVGYLLGTQNGQIVSLVAPIFGQKVYTGTLDLSSLQSTYQALKTNYDGTLTDSALIDGANKGLVSATGDQYTLYMTASEKTSFNDDLTGNIGGGIGAEIGLKDSQTVIVRVLDNNPAKEVGLKGGDMILKVNNESTTGWTVGQAVAKIRGDEGTTVKLSIKRDGTTKDYDITRDTIVNPSVYYSIKGGVGILTISRFDNETSSLTKAAANYFASEGVKGVVLDLRYNGGGYVDSAQDVLSLWLDNKVVVSERTGSTVISELKSGKNPVLAGLPTAVLVNSSSASASEIVAGALQDYRIAKIVGNTTFGKGSVQQLISLPNNAQLKVTIARWYTPNGKNITKDGITPDIKVGLTQAGVDAGKHPQMEAAIKSLNL